MTIEFYRKDVYGKQMIYIADEKMSKAMYNLTGKKTVTAEMSKALNELGFDDWKEVLPPEK